MQRSDLLGVTRQYLDSHGKLRLIEYEHDGNIVQVMVSPLAPMNLETMDELDIIPSPLNSTLDFLAEKEWDIQYQRVIDSQLEGLWVIIPGTSYAFIPIESDQLLQDVKISEHVPPLIPSVGPRGEDTDLNKFRRTKRLASVLKDYALYTYSLNPKNFGTDSFEIIPDHTYDIASLNKKLYYEKDGEINNVIYQGERMIVNSREIRNRLIMYVRSKVAHDSPGSLNFTRNNTITNYYQNSLDFVSRPNQLIFMDQSSIQQWAKNLESSRSRSNVFNTIKERGRGPYFYINYRINNGALAIVQHTEEGDRKSSLAIAKEWVRGRTNIGYTPDVIDEDLPEDYNVYTEIGTIKDGVKDPRLPSVIRYSVDDSNKYAALLFV